jgi:hypothetical protein
MVTGVVEYDLDNLDIYLEVIWLICSDQTAKFENWIRFQNVS